MLELSDVRAAVRYEGGISRRLFLAYGAAISAIPTLGLKARGQAVEKPTFEGDPFQLGVASGDPSHTGVVLWTRLSPKPLEGGGMPAVRVPVHWEIAADDAMRDILQQGDALATPQLGHSVHVEVEGLKPDRWYWYRFRAGDAVSPIGRTRTMPEPAAAPERLQFAFASCQHFETGLYTAYEHMAKDELDLVFHLGDYIYEGPGRNNLVRKHLGPRLVSLEDYRNRYCQYRSDPLLYQMHARCPWMVTWDDHEVENNYASDISGRRNADPAAFLEQRANAYQAFYEMMPLRKRSIPRGADMKIYRKLRFGRLAKFHVLDTRQYRTDQPNGDQNSDLNDEALSPKNTIMGAEQANWLKSGLIQSTATWNVLAQQVLMAMVSRRPGAERRYSMDSWTGYASERIRLMQFISERKVPNVVALTGDIHCNWVNDLRVDDRETDKPVVATEFVGTSISTDGNGQKVVPDLEALLANNPGVRFFNRQRGYVRCTLTPQTWQSDYQVVEEVTKPGGSATTLASFIVEAGQAGAKPA